MRDLGTINLHGSMDPRIIAHRPGGGNLANSCRAKTPLKSFVEEDTGYRTRLLVARTIRGRMCEIWTTERRAWRLESRVHPPEEFGAGGIRIMSSTGTARELASTPWQPTLNFYPRYRCASLNFQDIFADEGLILILSGITTRTPFSFLLF